MPTNDETPGRGESSVDVDGSVDGDGDGDGSNNGRPWLTLGHVLVEEWDMFAAYSVAVAVAAHDNDNESVLRHQLGMPTP